MQYLFLFILTGALAAAILALAWMGLQQRRRRGRLARAAHEIGMKFSGTDPFDLTRRYADFALPSAGHSQRAENVIYGRYQGWDLRVFDYHFEAGHGPRRLARHSSVVVAETELAMPAALMWHVGDAEHGPLAVRRPVARAGQWLVVSGAEFAPALAKAFADFAGEPVSVQTGRGCVMLCWAERFRPAALAQKLNSAASGLSALRAASGRLPAARPARPQPGESVEGRSRLC